MVLTDREIKLHSYLQKIEYVPTIPIVVNQVLVELQKPDVDLDEVADIIMADQVLTLRIIRLINSAFWGLQHQVQSLKEAIVYLGLREVRNVVLTTWLVNVFVSKVAKFKIETFWEHSFGCALLCRLIARQIGYHDPDRAYLGGLLHDVGEVIFCQYFPEEFAQIVYLVENQMISFHEAEEKIMGINHTDIGIWLIDHWHLPHYLGEVIEKHHTPQEAEHEPDLVAIVNLADLFCRLRGLGYGFYEKLEVIFENEPAWQVLTNINSSLKDIDLEKFTLDLDDRVDEVKVAVQGIYSAETEVSAV